jgi:hypothetical protein
VIVKELKEAGLQEHPATVLKIIQLYETKNSRYILVTLHNGKKSVSALYQKSWISHALTGTCHTRRTRNLTRWFRIHVNTIEVASLAPGISCSLIHNLRTTFKM